jgi:hypothetical protein
MSYPIVTPKGEEVCRADGCSVIFKKEREADRVEA